jgi:hypothetical protein
MERQIQATLHRAKLGVKDASFALGAACSLCLECFQDLGGASQEVLRYLRNHSLAEAQLISSAEVAQD